MQNRVAIFLPSLSGGGAEKTFVVLANWFARSGHAVDLLLMQRDGPYLDDLDASVRVIAPSARPRAAMAFASVVRYLHVQKPTALISCLNAPNIMAPFAGRLCRAVAGGGRPQATKLVVSQQVSLSLDSANSPSPRARFFPSLAKRSFALADVVVAASRGVKDDLVSSLALAGSRVEVVYNPVDLVSVERLSREPLHDPWLNGQGPPVIVGVGRLHPQKDFPSLIRALASLQRHGRPARLLILGEGPERARLEALAVDLGLGDSVRLHGFVANPFAYVRRADVFALSSRWEGFGNVILEALAVGTRVVSTDCPSGPAEILDGGRYGRLVPPQNPRALADAIGDALDEAPAEESLRARAREFGVDAIGAEWVKLLGLRAG